MMSFDEVPLKPEDCRLPEAVSRESSTSVATSSLAIGGTLPAPTEMDTAVSILQQGGLVAFPTETVYGLGADAENLLALERLYAVKGRPRNHPVIVHIASAAYLDRWVSHLPDAAKLLAQAFWPGPLTLILPRSERVPDAVTGGQDTVGIRVPDHPVALALLEAFGGGVAAPSANRFGRLSPTCATHVQADLGDDVDCVLDGGACPVGVESTIVAFQEGLPVILRPGMITSADIAAVLSQADRPATPSEGGNSSKKLPTLDAPDSLADEAFPVVRVPGALASHYAPRTPLELLPWEAILETLPSLLAQSVSVAVLARQPRPEALPQHPLLHWLQGQTDATDYARQLYASLRSLDDLGCEQILVESVPMDEHWAAVADRLARAAYGSNN